MQTLMAAFFPNNTIFIVYKRKYKYTYEENYKTDGIGPS